MSSTLHGWKLTWTPSPTLLASWSVTTLDCSTIAVPTFSSSRTWSWDHSRVTLMNSSRLILPLDHSSLWKPRNLRKSYYFRTYFPHKLQNYLHPIQSSYIVQSFFAIRLHSWSQRPRTHEGQIPNSLRPKFKFPIPNKDLVFGCRGFFLQI